MNSDLRIVVLCGGTSTERSVSLESGKAVFNALQKIFSNADLLILEENYQEQILQNQADVYVNILHGGYGENGELQIFMDKHGLAYSGSNGESCQITIDKIITKKICIEHKIPTAKFFKPNDHMSVAEIKDAIIKEVGLPVVIKPYEGGSSVDLYIIREPAELASLTWKKNFFAEEFIKGREFTVAVLEGKALEPIEIITVSGVYDFSAKYVKDDTKYEFDTLQEEQKVTMQKYAEKVFELTKCRDVARVDFLLKDTGEMAVLEINAIPGMTSHSLLPKSAAKIGVSFEELCSRLVSFAQQRKK